MEFLSQSKQPPAKLSKNLNLNRSEAELQKLEITFAKIITLTGQIILFCFCYRPANDDPSWMVAFDNFLHEVCDQFDNMVISGDFFFLPDILWDFLDSASGVNELASIETLHDHFLTQFNKKRTCGKNIINLLITSVPNRVNVTDILGTLRRLAAVFLVLGWKF